jgi:hypothetical protein
MSHDVSKASANAGVPVSPPHSPTTATHRPWYFDKASLAIELAGGGYTMSRERSLHQNVRIARQFVRLFRALKMMHMQIN